MKARKLREELQDDAHLRASDETHVQLGDALIATRQELGGISLMEIAEVIKAIITPQEVEQLKNDL